MSCSSDLDQIAKGKCLIRTLQSLVLSFFCGGILLLAQRSPSRLSFVPTPTEVERFQQATASLRNGHVEEAISGFRQLTRDAPMFTEAYLNLGLALAQVSRNEDAVTALGKAVALKPSLRGAHLFLAISEYKLSRLDPAALSIRKETTLNAADPQAWMWQGIIDLALGRLTTSVEDLDRASSLDPKNVDILYHRGRAALALSRQSYEAMFKLDPQSWHVHQVLAEADVESDRDADAVEQFKLAIAAAPPQSGLYEALGSSLWRTGKFQEAEAAYQTALRIDPNDTLTEYKLGCLRIDRGDAAGGKLLLDRVQLADPSLEMISYYLGRAELALGDERAAVKQFNKVIQENLDQDTTKQAYFQLSRAYRRLQNLTASKEAEAQYLALEKRNRDVLQDKLNQRRLRADRDTSIPAPSAPTDSQP